MPPVFDVNEAHRTSVPSPRTRRASPLTSERHIVLLLVAVTLLVSAILRLYHVGYPNTHVFDETYYVKDANTILKGQLGPPSADYSWEPGQEISWPHPEYGKLAIAAGIRLLHDNSRGWRAASIAAGLALLGLVYPTARRLHLPRPWALAALVLSAADMLLIAQSRLATLDIFVALWTLACVYCALRCAQSPRRAWLWLVLCGVAGGLAVGTKWSGALTLAAALVVVVVLAARAADGGARGPLGAGLRALFALLCLLVGALVTWLATLAVFLVAHGRFHRWLGLARHDRFFALWALLVAAAVVAGLVVLSGVAGGSARRWTWRALPDALLVFACLVVLPAALYFASYGLYFRHGHTLAQWWELQRQMRIFNFSLAAKHNYASQAWTWIFDVRPVWYFYFDKAAGSGAGPDAASIRGVVAMGNPLLWWASVPAILGLIGAAIVRRDPRLALVAALPLLLYLPWLGTTRTSFLYYMTPVVPFLAIVLATALALLAGDARPAWRWPVVAFAGGFLAMWLLWSAIGRAAQLAFWSLPAHVSPVLSAWVTGAALMCALAGLLTLFLWPAARRLWRYLSWAYVGAVAGTCAVFLPVVLAMPITTDEFYHLMWFGSWI
jgi:dolichyl-phosphate-mannose--protein O-mannosyl transferase